jgi:CheY-like chemotaxis protein
VRTGRLRIPYRSDGQRESNPLDRCESPSRLTKARLPPSGPSSRSGLERTHPFRYRQRLVGATSRPYVLIVEDEADTRRTVERALRDASLETVAVADGTAALAQCQRRDPAVIVLDLALPGLDGEKFADAYRRIPQSRARLIVISGTQKGGETAAKMRAYAYLSKPFRLDRLVEAAAKLISETSAG